MIVILYFWCNAGDKHLGVGSAPYSTATMAALSIFLAITLASAAVLGVSADGVGWDNMDSSIHYSGDVSA
jgi:hypothetical protein